MPHKVPQRFTEEVQQEIVQRYEAGETRIGLASAYGTKSQAIKNILELHAVEIRPHYQIKFTEEQKVEIAQRYANNESTSELAQEFDTSVTTVRKIARQRGIDIHPRGGRYRHFSQQEIEAMARLWDEGLSQEKIGEEHGVSQRIVSRVLAGAGYGGRSGHHHGMWKGGRIKHRSGYWQVKMQPDHPFASMRNREGYVMEHRLVMAQHLGRPLTPNEQVHHKNGERKDNRLENLQLVQKYHGPGIVMRCADCGSYNIVSEEKQCLTT